MATLPQKHVQGRFLRLEGSACRHMSYVIGHCRNFATPNGFAFSGTKVPAGPDWIHEVKRDGCRMLVVRKNGRVRLLTRNGYDRSDRYPWIVEAALKNPQKHFVIDGEAVVLGVDGTSDFDACIHASTMRGAALCLLARRTEGIFIVPFEQGGIGPDLFRQGCFMGQEGLVSKYRDRVFRAGRSPHWIKVKTQTRPR